MVPAAAGHNNNWINLSTDELNNVMYSTPLLIWVLWKLSYLLTGVPNIARFGVLGKRKTRRNKINYEKEGTKH